VVDIPKHEFVGERGTSCRAPVPGGPTCGYLHNADVHQDVRSVGEADHRVPPTSRRRIPWDELPGLTKAAGIVMLVGGGGVFLSACAAFSFWLLRVLGGIG
jgi:hypothetical protein